VLRIMAATGAAVNDGDIIIIFAFLAREGLEDAVAGGLLPHNYTAGTRSRK